MNLVNELLKGESRRLARVFRFSSSPCLRTENVAEHTFFVIHMCLMIYEDLCERYPDSKVLERLDLGILLSKATMHDMDEALTGDLPRPFKYFDPDTKEMINKVSERVFLDYATKARLPLRTIDHWKDAKIGPEGLIVKAVDLMQVVSYVHEEVHMGNRLILSKMGEVSRYMKEFVLYLETLQTTRGSDSDTGTLAAYLLPYVHTAIEIADTELRRE